MIHSHTQEIFERYIYSGCKVIELGDQLMDVGESTQFMRSDLYYKDINIISIDWHGNNRALKLDLSQPLAAGLDTELKGDIVTNFGTVEHVSDLYNGLLNMHNFAKDGAIMISANPKTGTFASHGYHFFTQGFWIELAFVCGYELIDTYEKSPYSDENPDIEVFAVFKKLSTSTFVNREDFEIVAQDTIFTS